MDQEALGAILMKHGELRACFEFVRVSCCVWMCACVVIGVEHIEIVVVVVVQAVVSCTLPPNVPD